MAATDQSIEKCTSLGNTAILQHPLLALFCSVQCPGDIILKTYDLALNLRDKGVPVISGFHTPMEKECLNVLIRGQQPVVICPARSLSNMRIPRVWRAPVEAGRLLLVSLFTDGYRRPTKALAEQRNRLVTELAATIFVIYAAPGGSTERFSRYLIESGNSVLTLSCKTNSNLIDLGARPVEVDDVVKKVEPVRYRVENG